MKLGNYDIKRAFLGSLPLTSKNAYIGQHKVISGEEPEPTGWKGLTFTAEQANSTIILTQKGTPKTYTTYDLETSTDGQSWNTYTIGDTITLANVGDKVYWRGNNAALGETPSIYKLFAMTGEIAASGNTNSLLDKENYDNTMPLQAYCYYRLFAECTSLTTAPELPATTAATYCYEQMFSNCTSLTTAPELPATTLAGYCYQHMFEGCTSLTAAPELPATKAAAYCYAYMFCGCSSLTTAPELPATTLAGYCYRNMFMRCINLTATPELPATTLVTGCYSNMFNGGAASSLHKLSEATTYATSWNISYTSSWLAAAAPSGTLYNLGGADIPTDNNSGCPTGWTIKTTKP